MQDKWLAGMIDELMTAWQENRGEVEIREAFAEILERSLQEKEARMRNELRSSMNALADQTMKLSDVWYRRDEIIKLLPDAITTDGAHHKQWYLQQIANILGVVVKASDPGIAP